MREKNLEQLMKIWGCAPCEQVRVLSEHFYKRPWAHLDLSLQNESLAHLDLANAANASKVIFSALHQNDFEVGYGGYGEERCFYLQSEHFTSPKGQRSVHLGVDLFVPEFSEVLCPWEGAVHSFCDNKNYLDYGPTIIIRHCTEGIVWHTLYGHLSRSSLEALAPGKEVRADARLAWVGAANENGGWPPHLHFQVILNLEGWTGDYPGVSTRAERELYLNNCPDPGFLLRPRLKGVVRPMCSSAQDDRAERRYVSA